MFNTVCSVEQSYILSSKSCRTFSFYKNIQRTCTSSEQLVTSVYQTLVSVDGWWTFRVSGRGVLVCWCVFLRRPSASGLQSCALCGDQGELVKGQPPGELSQITPVWQQEGETDALLVGFFNCRRQ